MVCYQCSWRPFQQDALRGAADDAASVGELHIHTYTYFIILFQETRVNIIYAHKKNSGALAK